jgi:hypothetical protein
MAAFHAACDQGEFEVAGQLLRIMELLSRRPPPDGRLERASNAQPLVAAHERLWWLRHPEVAEE